MKIGIIVEGREEREALTIITKKIVIKGCVIYDPLYAAICPKATPKQIAKAAESRIKILQAKEVNKIILAIDLEDITLCPGEWAGQLEDAFKGLGYHDVCVVVKNKKFENWLIADPGALKKMSEFTLSNGAQAKILKKADNIPDAEKMLTNSKKGILSYHKGKDGCKIAQKCDPLIIAQNSRSFRRFLRLLNHPTYKKQSKSASS